MIFFREPNNPFMSCQTDSSSSRPLDWRGGSKTFRHEVRVRSPHHMLESNDFQSNMPRMGSSLIFNSRLSGKKGDAGGRVVIKSIDGQLVPSEGLQSTLRLLNPTLASSLARTSGRPTQQPAAAPRLPALLSLPTI